MLHVSRYKHLNPLEAGIVSEIDKFQWSSYPYYIGLKKKPEWMYTNFVINYFHGESAIQKFITFTEAGNDKNIVEFYTTKRIRPVLASDKFIENLYIKKTLSTEISNRKILCVKYSFEDIVGVIEKVTGKEKKVILSSCRGQMNIYRSIYIYLSRNIGGYKVKVKDIANYLLHCKYSSLSLALTNFEKNLKNSTELQSLIAICKMELCHNAKRK